jgi:hypothetical protein
MTIDGDDKGQKICGYPGKFGTLRFLNVPSTLGHQTT